MKNKFILLALSLVAVVAIGVTINATRASAINPVTTIFSDGFGTGNTDLTFNEDPTWNKGGGALSAEKRKIGTGDDSASTEGGRFVVALVPKVGFVGR